MFGERNFGLFWIGQTSSNLGDYLLLIALPYYIYGQTSSALASGVAFVSELLPSMILGPIAGVVADRWDRRQVMVVSDVGRAVVLLGLIAEPHAPAVWTVYVIAVTKASLTQVFGPAKSGAFPQLVDESKLLSGNAAMSAGGEMMGLVGPGLGGIVYAIAGIKLAAGLDALSYIVSAATLVAIPVLRGRPSRESVPQGALRGLVDDLCGGLGVVARSRSLRVLIIATGILQVAGGMIATIWVPFARLHLHAVGWEYGLALSAQSVGGLIGAVVVGRIMTILGAPRVPLGGATVVIGAAVFCLSLTSSWIWAAAILAVGGAPTTIQQIVAARILQTEPPDEYRGRVSSINGVVTSIGVVIGLLGAGGLVTALGVVQSTVVCAGVFVLAGIVFLGWFPALAPKGS